MTRRPSPTLRRPRHGEDRTPGRSRSADQGSITVMVALLLPAVMLVIGLVIDGGNYLRAAREATTVAQEAARAAGQRLTPDALEGQASSVDPIDGADAARSFLRAADVQGQVVISGDTITIATTTTWQPALLGLIGMSSGTATGSATVTTERT